MFRLFFIFSKLFVINNKRLYRVPQGVTQGLLKVRGEKTKIRIGKRTTFFSIKDFKINSGVGWGGKPIYLGKLSNSSVHVSTLWYCRFTREYLSVSSFTSIYWFAL